MYAMRRPARRPSYRWYSQCELSRHCDLSKKHELGSKASTLQYLSQLIVARPVGAGAPYGYSMPNELHGGSSLVIDSTQFGCSDLVEFSNSIKLHVLSLHAFKHFHLHL
jgi:hypothetical protein